MKLFKFLIAIVVSVFFQSTVEAADLQFFGSLPYISQTGSIASKWDYNVYIMQTNTFNSQKLGKKTIPPRAAQFYFQPSIIYKISPRLNFSLGYSFQRLRPYSPDYQNENRVWQQVSILQPLTISSRLTHRIRFEERFIANRATQETQFSTRLRYQIGFYMPFEGKTLEPGEFYFNCYNEFYFNTSGKTARFYNDNWTYAGIGYQTDGFGKIEIGPLYQTLYTPEGNFFQFFLTQVGWITNF